MIGTLKGGSVLALVVVAAVSLAGVIAVEATASRMADVDWQLWVAVALGIPVIARPGMACSNLYSRVSSDWWRR